MKFLMHLRYIIRRRIKKQGKIFGIALPEMESYNTVECGETCKLQQRKGAHMRIPVVVDCSPKGVFRYHVRLRRFELDRDKRKKYRGTIPERKLERLKEYCRERHLRFYIDNEYGTRSSN